MHLLLTLAAVQFLSSPAPTDDSLTFRRQLPYFATRDLSGRTWRPADLQDKFTVVDIWATWCAPCRKQHPELQRFYEKLNPRIQILSIAVEEQPELVRLYLTRNHYTFPVIADPKLAGQLFEVSGLPQTLVINPQLRRSEPFQTWTFGRILSEVEKAAK